MSGKRIDIDQGSPESRDARSAIFALIAASEGGAEIYGQELSRVALDMVTSDASKDTLRRVMIILDAAAMVAKTAMFSTMVYREHAGLETDLRSVMDATERVIDEIIARAKGSEGTGSSN